MATSQYGHRLEIVRRRLGYESLRQFGAALDELGPPEIPYHSVVRWHGTREPSIEYLSRVSRRFGVRLEWLVSGELPMLASEVGDEDRGDLVRRLRARIPDLDVLPVAVTITMVDYLDRRDRLRGAAADTSGWLEHAADVWVEIMGPVGGRRPEDLRAFGDYVTAALHARSLALPLAFASGGSGT